MQSFVPQIYSIGSRSRFVQYNGPVRTSVPGAGYRGRRMKWDTQPLLLGGLGSLNALRHHPNALRGSGLGVDLEPGQVASVIANLIVNPEAELSARGGALATALQRHIAGPLVEAIAKEAQPYLWKYIVPPLVVLYALVIVAAVKSWQAETRLARSGK